MMRFFYLLEVLESHKVIIASSGGLRGIRGIESVQSAINRSWLFFNQTDLYPDLISKSAALFFCSL